MDVVASHADHSHDAFFIQAMANKVYYVWFTLLTDPEPYMTLAMAGLQPEIRRDCRASESQVYLGCRITNQSR